MNPLKEAKMKNYRLIGPDGKPYESTIPGTLGGHKRHKGYGRLDCPSALQWIAKGYYPGSASFSPTRQRRSQRAIDPALSA